MLNKLDDIQQSIQNLAGTRRVALTRNQYFDEWPLLTVAQFNDLKRRLSDPGFFNEAVSNKQKKRYYHIVFLNFTFF